jgi:diguanylate cyclase (GGDEF)-like protein
MMRREREGHQRAATTDQLTGAANSRRFNAVAVGEVERAGRYGHAISLAFLDVDGFKSINDTLGHAEGDRVLARAGHLLQYGVRSSDTVARIGGDEFAILMPETKAEAAGDVLRRVRTELDRLVLSDGRRVSFSVGLVSFDRPPASVLEMTVSADELMYRAKNRGRDRMEQAEKAGSLLPNHLHRNRPPAGSLVTDLAPGIAGEREN